MLPSNLVVKYGFETKTTSLKVAEVFGKEHFHVLRDIDALLTQVIDLRIESNFGCSGGVLNSTLIFEEKVSEAEVGFGVRKNRYFEMNKNAFTLLVMGYTGEKALEFKLAYIAEFDRLNQLVIDYQHRSFPETQAAFYESLRLKLDSGVTHDQALLETSEVFDREFGYDVAKRLGLKVLLPADAPVYTLPEMFKAWTPWAASWSHRILTKYGFIQKEGKNYRVTDKGSWHCRDKHTSVNRVGWSGYVRGTIQEELECLDKQYLLA